MRLITRLTRFLLLAGLVPIATVSAATVSAPATDASSCAEHRISAGAVRTTSDVQAFVRCAAEYLAEHGTAEARRAFHEDERWKHGPIYLFVDQVAPSADEALVYVYPRDPSREGDVWGTYIDAFGTDYYSESFRMLGLVDSGWMYYWSGNPSTGTEQPKSSYLVEVDWDGQRAAVGAGIYAPDLPSTCSSEEVNAADLAAAPSEAKLQAFVRCAAMLLEEQGYFAREELETSSRWRHGSSYVFVMDLEGNQVLTGHGLRVNGKSLHEFGGKSDPMDQFGGRDMVAVGDAFGEALIYYRNRDPRTGGIQPKVGMLKRVVSHGVPLILGAGYELGSQTKVSEPACDENRVTARGIRTRRDIQAFVRCAAEYIELQGEEEAYRAFHNDERWRHDDDVYYVFVNLLGPTPERFISGTAVFPPQPFREGASRELVDNFGTDYYYELHRVLRDADEGWLHYAFTNFKAGRSEPKSSYVVEVDWNGHRAAVGAGIYLHDLPGTCPDREGEVNAAALEADPSEKRLREFVRCAAFEVESQGYFAGATLASDPRWKSDSIYVFGVDMHGNTLFSGAPGGSRSGMRASELSPAADQMFGGQDRVSVGDAFGEALLHYTARNPSTNMPERKVTVVKRVMVQGLPILVGGGYYPDYRMATMPPSGGSGGGTGAPGGGVQAAGRGDTATLMQWQAPTTLNPYLSRGTKDTVAASLVIEPLAEYDPDGALVPVLAARIPSVANGGIPEDRASVTWSLREDVVWSDGTPLTANDVVATWRLCTAGGIGCAGASRFDRVVSVEAVDERTVTVMFDSPVAFPFLPFVSVGSPVLQASQFADCLDEGAACTDANRIPVGTGPYVAADFRGGESVRYEFNPQYRGAGAGQPYFREVLLQGGGDAIQAARSVLELDEADYAWNLQIDPDTLAAIAAGGNGVVVSEFASNVERLVLNQTNPDASLGELRSEYADGANPHPFLTDPVVGRALSLAIDRSALVRIGYGDLAGRPTCNIWPVPGQASSSNNECLVQNIELANSILDDAGITDSDGDGVREREGVPLRVLFQTSTNAVRQATQEHIKAWWAEIGVETELKQVAPSVFFGNATTSPDTVGRFYADVQMYTTGSSGVDAEGYFVSWTTDQIARAANSFQGSNAERFSSDEFDRLHRELRNTFDPDMRQQIIISLNDLLVQSYATIPLIHRGSVAAHGNDIEGFRANDWGSDLWNIEAWTRRE